MKKVYKINIQNKLATNHYGVAITNPIELSKYLFSNGADELILVDLDGAFEGTFTSYDVLEEILHTVDIPVSVGGGIRSYETAQKLLSYDISRIILGTAAIKNQELLIQLLSNNSQRIVVSIDGYDSSVFIDGWEESVEIQLSDLIKTLALLGVEEVLYTDLNHFKNSSTGDTLIDMSTIDALCQSSSIEIIVTISELTDSCIIQLSQKGIKKVVLDKISNRHNTDNSL